MIENNNLPEEDEYMIIDDNSQIFIGTFDKIKSLMHNIAYSKLLLYNDYNTYIIKDNNQIKIIGKYNFYLVSYDRVLFEYKMHKCKRIK